MACERGLPCGTPLGQGPKLAAPKDGRTAPAGMVGAPPELAALATDVKRLAVEAQRVWGDVPYDRRMFERLRRQAAQPATDAFRMTTEEAKQFVTGTVTHVTAAYVKARELAALPVQSPTHRDQVRATQRRLAQSARAMLDHATRALEEAAARAGGGTSGLGVVCGGACIAGIVVVASVAVIVAGATIYSWNQSASELDAAMEVADQICRGSAGGCSSAERARIIQDLRMPDPVSRGVENLTGPLGRAFGTVALVVGIGGALTVAGWAFLRFTDTGRRISARVQRRLA